MSNNVITPNLHREDYNGLSYEQADTNIMNEVDEEFMSG
jgi:hypothetical protein